MKKIISFILLLGVLCLAGCSKDELTGGSFEEQVKTFENDICFGGKFVEREFKDFIANGQNFKAIVKQKDYIFNPDGTGLLTTYIMNQTAKGYKATEDNFTWTVSDTPPLSLKIRIGQFDSFTLDEASVDNDFLSSKNEDWAKELIVHKDLTKEDIISYSTEYLYGWTERIDIQMFVYITPTILTVKTKRGVMRFIRSQFGYNSTGFPHGAFEKIGGEYVLIPGNYEANIYFQVDPSNSIFYDVNKNLNDVDFKTIENGVVKYNFPVGYIEKDHSLSLIDNNKNYQLD